MLNNKTHGNMEKLFKKMLNNLTDEEIRTVKSIIDEIIMDREYKYKSPDVEITVLDMSVLKLDSVKKSDAWKYNFSNEGINTIRDLIKLSYGDLMRFHMIGHRKIIELRQELDSRFQIKVWED